METRAGLTENTARLFDAISQLECIKPYVLVGGTALSLQLATRLSEDLDFMSWRTSRTEVREVDWPAIRRELAAIGNIERFDMLDFDHVEFVVDGVKLSFYANPNFSPFKAASVLQGNLRLADPVSIGAMKMEVMLRRSKFRDYYDIYSLLRAGVSLSEMVSLALTYSGHRLKSKNLIALLTRSDRFAPDAGFPALKPVYDVTPADIEQAIKEALKAASS